MKKLIAISAVLLLSACGTGPSESDMNTAVQKQAATYNNKVASIGSVAGSVGQNIANSFKVEAPKVKKIGCKPDGENAFLCDVELVAKDTVEIKQTRFLKASDGWIVAE